jgi:HEPN domain-containing protein
MKPHIEEAWRALQLADRDIKVFDILRGDPEAHLSIVCFHAQQAVEKSLKAVLFSRRIEFRRTHNLTELAQLLRQHGVEMPVADDPLRRLNPFAVTFRYDDMDIELVTREDAAS